MKWLLQGFPIKLIPSLLWNTNWNVEHSSPFFLTSAWPNKLKWRLFQVLPTGSSSNLLQSNEEVILRNKKRCRVLFSYQPVHDDELELKVTIKLSHLFNLLLYDIQLQIIVWSSLLSVVKLLSLMCTTFLDTKITHSLLKLFFGQLLNMNLY